MHRWRDIERELGFPLPSTYLERSWRWWKCRRWCQIAAEGTPNWTHQLSHQEMGFLEYVWYMLFNSSRWYYLDQLVTRDVFHKLAACPCLYSSSFTAKTTFLHKSAANLFSAEHSSLVQKPQRKTTSQSRLRIAAQETEPTRERDEFKSKFAVQALSYATCPSDNTYFEVIQSSSK